MIDRRRDARIVRSALDEVKAIQTLLADVYKDAGDGRTLVRELVQNADDARAKRLAFAVLDQGWPEARNGLLRGSALLVANDAPFPARDRDALHRALGGSKADDAGKVGTFGLGLKSVFHICEAVAYLGAEGGVLRPGALNPWAGTGERGDADPIHPDWDTVDDGDLERLLGVGRALLGRFEDGLVLWIPLRCPVHLDRARDRQYGLGQACPAPEDLARWFGRSASLALLLAQCGHLRTIEAHRTSAPETLPARAELARVERPEMARSGWVGRHDDDAPTPARPFAGTVEDGGRTWSVVGLDALGHDALRLLRSATDWPNDPHWRDGRSVWVPRKALAHAAVTILRPAGTRAAQVGARLRWAVFLPLDDDPNPRPSAVVETVGNAGGETWDIVLHGYFWPSQDRRSIPGVTDDDAGAGEGAVRVRWNRAVRDELLLPLLPGALASAVLGTPEGVVRRLLSAIKASRTVQTHLPAITKSKLLLPVLAEGGVRWEARERARIRVLSVPHWDRAPSSVRTQFPARHAEGSDSVVFIDDDAPRLGGEPGEWPVVWIERLLNCVPVTALRSSEDLSWVTSVVHHVLGRTVGGSDDGPSAAARWLAKRIGEEALASTTEGVSDDAKRELRVAWRRLFAELPEGWLVDAPVEAQRAVVELAVAGLVGAGLCPVPLGRRRGADRPARPDADRLDSALLELGRRLSEEDGSSQRTRRSRLLLAETLLSARGDRPLGERLGGLPLLRALRLPDGRDEAWSVAELRRQTVRHRVFARPGADDGDDDASLEAPSDPKRAVGDLAEALSDDVWLVDYSVASTTGAPVPTTVALAMAVLHAGAIPSDPSARVALLRRLAASGTDPTVHRSMRTLLTGRAATAGEEELLYVRSRDSDQGPHRKTLEILLRLLDRSWGAIDPALVEPLPPALVEELRVRAVDAGRLHRLLDECLQQPVDWTRIERADALHLLRRLFGTTPEERTRWRAMPLHRGAGGDRGAFDDRALRTAGGLRLPVELEAEIRLLDPDPELADLYQDVRPLDDDGILRAMLVSARPQRFAKQIVLALLTGHEEHPTLPRDLALVDLLRRSAWLPRRDVDAGVAPEAVLLAPPELQAGLEPLAAAGALGNHRLPDAIAPALWRMAEGAVHEIVGRPSRARQAQRVAQALKPDLVARVEGGAYLILPNAARVEASLVEDALQTPLAGSHLGWMLLRTAKGVLSAENERPGDAPAAARDAVIALARSLCGPVPASHQARTLRTISESSPSRDSPAGRLFRCLMESFAATADFVESVLPHIELPTQDGQWHPAREVARSASGVARRHRVIQDLRCCLRLDDFSANRAGGGGGGDVVRIEAESPEILATYFKPWNGRLPLAAVGAFVSLLGGGLFDYGTLAQQWLGTDSSVEGMQSDLLGEAEDARLRLRRLRVVIRWDIACGAVLRATNLLGEEVKMAVGTDLDTIFAADPERQRSQNGDYWRVKFRDVGPGGRTGHELVALLGETVEWWAVHILGLDLQRVRAWWSRWGTGSQAQVGPVRASVLAHLPLTLRQLDVGKSEPLSVALREAQRAQRQREQTPHLREAVDAERKALDGLAALICHRPDHQRFVWGRVQELMRLFGYRDDSVLLELAQNADDALAQAAEIADHASPPAARRLLVRVHDRNGVRTVDVTHHGRPINDTGGASFPAGRDRQWDQDLYFMMLLNLSGKPGEEPGQAVASSTTGRFGLGFKAVHLVSPAPAVVSGFLAFSIAGGLLPQEEPIPNDSDLLPVEGHRATRVRLPLRSDVDADGLIAKLFRRFAYARTLLPVFARQLREVVVDGGPSPGVSAFDAEGVDGAPGWSVAAGPTEISGHGQYRIVRFRPADGGTGTGTGALAFGLRAGVAAPFPQDLPFLWNVTPTSEGWGCGYAVNGPFKLDPGRTHVSLDDEATLRVVDGLGVALGSSLVELHDALVRTTDATGCVLPTGADATPFLASLWAVLVSGLDSRDDLRRRLLQSLHGPGRGLSVWMAARAVVPCGLPAPFPETLPPLASGMRIEVAVGGLDDPDLCRALADIEDVASVVESHRVVSGEVAQRLRPLLRTSIRELRPADILAEVAERWDQVLTPARLHALRPFASDAIWKRLATTGRDTPWHSQLVARSEDGTPAPLRNLLIPRDQRVPDAEADAADEPLRAAFAPDDRVLDPAYIARAEDLAVFQRLRVRHQIDAATMAAWYDDLLANRRPAALRYLMYGKLQQEVLRRLVPIDTRPPWLDEYDAVRRMLDDLGEEEWRCKALLAALFAERFQEKSEPAPPPSLPESAKRTFFERLVEWWDEADVRDDVIGTYETKAWPEWLRRKGIADGLRTGSRDHWLGLLILGACQSLGRAHDGHHRSFLEAAHGEGWWEVFKAPEDAAPWMDVLRTWQDRSVADLTYSRWMALFPAIYQLSRYLETYRRLLSTAGRRPAELYRVTCLLAPRVDEALSGAGQQFDAPPAPLNMGLHWILRELVRLGVLDGDHVLPDCWVPSEQVLRFLRPLGLDAPDGVASNSDKAHAVSAFLAAELGTPNPHLHRAFDIPLRHVDTDVGLRRQLGLEG